MQIRLLIIGLFFLVQHFSYSQNTIQKLFGGYDVDEAAQIIRTKDNNYVILGQSYSFGSGGYDIVLTKINKYGNVIWNKAIGDDKNQYALNLRECKDRGFIILAMHSYNSTSGYLLIKTDLNGIVQWSKLIYGTNSGKDDIPSCVSLTQDGGYLVSGRTYDGSEIACIFKIDSIGNVIWAKTYQSNEGTGYNWGAKETKSGNIIFYGFTQTYKTLVSMLDSEGNIIWEIKSVREGGVDIILGENCLIELKDGNFLFATETDQYSGVHDILLYFLNTNGTITKKIIYSGGSTDYVTGVKQTSDNGFILTGGTGSIGNGSGQCFLMKLDSVGNREWLNFFGSGSWACYPQEAIDGGYIFTGTTSEECGLSKSDIYVMKTDNKGLNNCMGFYGNFQRKDTVAIVSSPNFTVSNLTLNVSSLNLSTTSFTYFESNICKDLDVKKSIAYPNPFVDETTLRIDFDYPDKLCPSFIGAKLLYLKIYDLTGRLVRKEEISNNIANLTTRIDYKIYRKNMNSGMYIWELTDKFNHRITVNKIVAY